MIAQDLNPETPDLDRRSRVVAMKYRWTIELEVDVADIQIAPKPGETWYALARRDISDSAHHGAEVANLEVVFGPSDPPEDEVTSMKRLTPEFVKLAPEVHDLAARLAREKGRLIKETIRIALELLDEKERVRGGNGWITCGSTSAVPGPQSAGRRAPVPQPRDP